MHISDWLPPAAQGTCGEAATQASWQHGQQREEARNVLLVAVIVAAACAAVLLLDRAGIHVPVAEEFPSAFLTD